MRPAFYTFSSLFLCSLLLTGCDGTRSVSEIANRPNTFPPTSNALDDFDDNTTGDSSNTNGLAENEVLVTVEVPRNVAPDGELTRRNLSITEPDRIDVYQSDNTLRQLASVDVDIRTENENRRVITFNDGVPVGPDVIIEVSVGNSILRAVASDSDRDIKINPFSEYLVSNALSNYTGAEFQQVMDCVNSGSEDLCINKYVWSTLSDQVHDFEIDIGSNLTVQQAVNYLADRADFSDYVDDMATYALLDSESSGKISASSVDYNSVLLGIELGQNYQEPSLNNPGQWGVRIAQEERLEDENGVAYIYPALTLTSFDVFNIRVTSLASDVPYDRETLLQTATNDFFSRGADVWDTNTHATAPGAATLEDDLRLLTGRALYQSITGRNSSLITGWTRNPYFQDAYVGGGSEEADQVITSYFSGGKAIELDEVGDDLKRQQTLEEHYVSFFELNLERQFEFSLDVIGGNTYNVLTFAMALDGNALDPMVLTSEVGSWTSTLAGDGDSVTMAGTLSPLVVSRDNSGIVTNPPSADTPDTRTVTLRESRFNSGDKQVGRLAITTGASANSVGASAPDGNLLAFNLDDDSDLGDGLIIAATQATAAAPNSGTYRVQGISLGQDNTTNRLTHYQNAELGLTTGQGTLTLRGLEVVHTVSPSAISEPSAIAEQTITLNYVDNGNGQVTFTDNASSLVLEGFITDDQDKFFLRLFDDTNPEVQIGLIIATRLP